MDREDFTLLSLLVHVPFVTAWVGLVMFDMFAVLLPGLDGDQRARMIAWSRPFVLIAVPVILITGIWQTMTNPFFDVNSWRTLERLRESTTYGQALFWKHGCVLVTFALTSIVRFVLAPQLAVRAAASDGAVGRFRAGLERWLLGLSALNLLACLGAVLLATRMVIELH